jgi:hypothetical protein
MIESPGHVLSRIIKDFGDEFVSALSGKWNFVYEVSRAMSRAHREWVKFEKRCRKYRDPKWQRRYAKALKRSRRNVAYLKRTGRCR